MLRDRIPCVDHQVTVLRIFRYIKKTLGQDLLYEDKGDTHILGYCDADWIGSPIDRRSTIVFLLFVSLLYL
ncbi:putative mitochondrial protein, partial [Mucuna pruriens]